jgi:hypothetical protein
MVNLTRIQCLVFQCRLEFLICVFIYLGSVLLGTKVLVCCFVFGLFGSDYRMELALAVEIFGHVIVNALHFHLSEYLLRILLESIRIEWPVWIFLVHSAFIRRRK